MKRFLVFGVMWMAQLAPAQNALWVDLSGDWRVSADDRPEYAAPDFGDSTWPTLALPRGRAFFGGPSTGFAAVWTCLPAQTAANWC